MAKKAGKKPRPKTRVPRPAAKAARPSRAGQQPTEHRIAVAGIALHVRHGRGRYEELELRGTAALNLGAPESVVRTTGVVLLMAGQSTSTLVYNPASLNRNLVLRLAVDTEDLELLRAIFITGTGSELSDPALTVWATTTAPLAPDSPAEVPVTGFGYSLDFDPAAGPGHR